MRLYMHSGVARNSQWLRGSGGGLGADPTALGDFCNFSKNNAFLCIFRPK